MSVDGTSDGRPKDIRFMPVQYGHAWGMDLTPMECLFSCGTFICGVGHLAESYLIIKSI